MVWSRNCFGPGRGGCAFGNTLPKKTHQFRVHFFGMCPGYAVRPTLHDQLAGSLDQLGSPES